MQIEPDVPSSLIACYYEGATQPGRYSQALQQMLEYLHCEQARLTVWDSRGNWGCAHQALRDQDRWQLSSQDHVLPRDEIRKLVSGLQVGNWQVIEQAFPVMSHADGLPQTSVHQPALCIRLLGGQGTEAFLSFKKNNWDGRSAQRLLPHAEALTRPLIPALHLMLHMRRLTQQTAYTSMALDCIRMPMLLLDPAMRVLVANTAAQSLLQTRGNRDSGAGSMMLAGVSGEKIGPLVRHACGLTGPVVASVLHANANAGESALQILVLPVAAKAVLPGAGPAALVLVHGQSSGHESVAQLLQHIYKLTPAEARLAMLILRGESPAAAALSLQVSVPTVRSQISAILKKTGALRQSDLVRRLSALLLISQRHGKA
ncbi:MAG: helix-turn-helix transcriptional regulator [Burkholderiaceae bacterium]